MKKQVEIIILLLFGLAFLVYLFPFIFVEAAKLQSGVTINATSTTETEKICDDTIDNDNDGKIDANDEDCAAEPEGPTTGTCGLLRILSGVPINYGELTLGQLSAQKRVIIENEGTSLAKVMLKGGDWISDAAGNPIISGPEITRVGLGTGLPTFMGSYSEMKGLTSNGWELGQINVGQQMRIYFQFKAPANAPSGSFHQEVSIDLLCGGNEFLQEGEGKVDNNTIAKTPNPAGPIPIPYPDTNNITKK